MQEGGDTAETSAINELLCFFSGDVELKLLVQVASSVKPTASSVQKVACVSLLSDSPHLPHHWGKAEVFWLL